MPVAEPGDALLDELFDRRAGLRQSAPVCGIAPRLGGEDKAFRRGGRPFGEAFRLLRRIIGGVDLYRRQTAGGMFQLLRLRELGWIEAALPRLIGPAADTDMNGLGHRPTIAAAVPPCQSG